MHPLAIRDVALRCALGTHVDQVRAALVASESGLVPWGTAHGLPFETYFGAIPGRPAPPLTGALAAYDSRQAREALAALEVMRDTIDGLLVRYGRDRIGVIVGSTTGGMAQTERYAAYLRETGNFPSGFDFDKVHHIYRTAEVIAHRAGVRGPCFVQSSACSSSAKVLASAQRLIALGVIDAAIVGGVDTSCRYTLLGFHSLGILSSRRCQPFGAARDGINLGEASALLVVERAERAEKPMAYLRGVGETSDAFHATQPRPGGEGLANAITQVLSESSVDASAVSFVNAHATGTPLNDAAEALALATALPHRPPIVATKGLTGHTLGAAGAVEAILCVLALGDGRSPGTLTMAPLMPETDALDVRTEAFSGSFRYALSTSAAFAGHNAAVLLEAP